jgi:hypothetical protein
VKFFYVGMALVVKQTFEKRGRGRKLMRPKMWPSAQEVAVAKPLGRWKKLFAKTSRLSIAFEASLAELVLMGEN